MKRVALAVVMVTGLTGTAAAQAPGQIPAQPAPAQSIPAPAPGQVAPAAAVGVSSTFLEKRVPDELAAEGVVLSRRNLGVRIEQIGERWLVSLADLTTGRIAASTSLDALPRDREAAVAAMTHVVAELATQVVGRNEPPPPPPPPAESSDMSPFERMRLDQQAERAERAEHERQAAAKLAFDRQLIRFTRSYDPDAHDPRGERVRWTAYRGAPGQALDPKLFYREVGRPDLAASYDARRNIMIVSFVGTGLAFVGAYAWLFYNLKQNLDEERRCLDLPFDQHASCLEGVGGPSYTEPLVMAALGGVALGTGIYYALHRQPISETEARTLAAEYNRRLGTRGVPPVPTTSLLHDVRIAPYAGTHGAGLALGARF
jgi:hypothetical protein